MTFICVFGICVGVSSGKGGIHQPLCRQFTYESSPLRGTSKKNVGCALESAYFQK